MSFLVEYTCRPTIAYIPIDKHFRVNSPPTGLKWISIIKPSRNRAYSGLQLYTPIKMIDSAVLS